MFLKEKWQFFSLKFYRVPKNCVEMLDFVPETCL